jgi:hypothetical protein
VESGTFREVWGDLLRSGDARYAFGLRRRGTIAAGPST